MPSLCNVLGAAQVKVNSIAMWSNDFCRLEKIIWIVGAKLDDEWPVGRWISLFSMNSIKLTVTILSRSSEMLINYKRNERKRVQ
jgi:hypothetical protein